MSVGVKGAEIRDLGGTATKESVTESGAAREEHCCPARLQGTAGWRPLPSRRYRLGAQAEEPREAGQVTPGTEAAGLSPRGRQDRLRLGTVASPRTQNLACASQDPPDLRRPSENRERKEKTAAAAQ